MMNNPQIYLRFLTLVHTIERAAEWPSMDLDAKRLLEVISVRHDQKLALTVSEAMALSQIASPATIHRKLDVLRELELIETQFEGNNRRSKYLVPTPKAMEYFSGIGKAMKQALSVA